MNTAVSKKKRKLYLADYDHIMLSIAILLTLFGVYLQFNIGTSLGDSFQMGMFINQLKSLIFAVVVFVIFFFPNDLSKFLYKGSFIFVLITIGLLIFVLFKGITTQGSTRWIRLPFISFQPSSLAHPVLIIFYAKQFDRKKDILKNIGFVKFIKEFPVLIIITFSVIMLIFLEKHLSTLIVLGLTLISLIYVAEFKKSLILVLVLIISLTPLFVIRKAKDYRSARVSIYAKYSLFHKVLGIESEINDKREYQVRESLTAISQGGLFGTGSERGRAKHKFLPDVNSDYIFAMIGEQFGFFGGLIIIALFCTLLFRTVVISSSTDSYFKMIVAFGMGINIFINAIVNIGVALSALPSTGLPLPFISYGGSALAANAGMLAVILNFSSKRRVV